jgi:FtsZ-binding cell division protein ZapB
MRNWIKAINPGALGEGPSPQEQQLQQHLQQAMQMIQQLQQELHDKTKAQEMEKQRLDMDALNHLALRMENDRETLVQSFKAETDRIKALLGALDPEQTNAIVRKMVQETLTAPNPAKNLSEDRMDPDAAYAAGMETVLAPLEANQGA